jgi:predicted nucleotidyltransferase
MFDISRLHGGCRKFFYGRLTTRPRFHRGNLPDSLPVQLAGFRDRQTKTVTLRFPCVIEEMGKQRNSAVKSNEIPLEEQFCFPYTYVIISIQCSVTIIMRNKTASLSITQSKKLDRIAIMRILTEHPRLLKRYTVRKIGLFGSRARGDEQSTSDIDLLVEFESTTFDNFMNLSFALERLFKNKVDLVTPESLSDHIKPYIEREVLWHEV